MEISTNSEVNAEQNMHPTQNAFIDYGAVQCGYYEPAFIVTAYALLNQNSKPSRNDIVTAITPILCRCTGYIQIIEVIEAMVKGDYKKYRIHNNVKDTPLRLIQEQRNLKALE